MTRESVNRPKAPPTAGRGYLWDSEEGERALEPLSAPAAPLRLTPGTTLGLQRAIGNRAVSRLLQGRSAPARAAVSHAPALIVQRVMKPQQVISTLSELMKSHGLEAQYNMMWGTKDIARIAKEVGDMPDTDKDNVKRRLTEHRDILPLLRPHRMILEPGVDTDFGDKDMRIVFEAYKRLLFFHATKYVDSVLSNGLDPNFGGKEGGMSDERSTPGKRAANVAASKGHVYLSRKESEAKQYAKEGAQIVHVLVPLDMQGGLEVDPDSLKGVFGSRHLQGIATPDGRINWWGELFLKKEMDSRWKEEEVPHISLVPAIFKALAESGAIRSLAS